MQSLNDIGALFKAANDGWQEAQKHGISIGMALAAAMLVRDFDSPTHAREILGAAGIDNREAVTSLGLDDYDVEPLLKIV